MNMFFENVFMFCLKHVHVFKKRSHCVTGSSSIGKFIEPTLNKEAAT